MSSSASLGRSGLASIVVGIDLVEVETVAESIGRFGDRYLARVFTPAERRYCASVASDGGDSAPHLAARFAAKEAVMKVLRPTPADGLAWKSIEVVRHADGYCTVSLSGAAKTLAKRAGLRGFAISLSHERRYATAVAVAEAGCAPKARTARPPVKGLRSR